MSLKDAILEIAEQIEADAEEGTGGQEIADARDLRAYARQLRAAVKAAGDEQPILSGAHILAAHGCKPDGPEQARLKLEAARLERAANSEDNQGIRMVELLDGSNEGLCEMHGVPMSMQVGQAIDIGRRVFVLRKLDNGTHQLHLHPEETQRRFGGPK